MVIYSLLSETVLYSSKKKKKKKEEKKKKKKPINPVLLSLKMFPLPIACVISKKKKKKINVVNLMASRLYIYIGHRFIYGTPQCLH